MSFFVHLNGCIHGCRVLMVVSVVFWLGPDIAECNSTVKMSCQLMEELPIAAGRSVATGAMCVNLLPCHFSCLPSRLPFISTYFSFPFLPHPLPSDFTPSTYGPLWQMTPGGWFVACQKYSSHWHEGRVSRRSEHFPTPILPAVINSPLPTPHLTHLSPQSQCWNASVEIDILSCKISSD